MSATERNASPIPGGLVRLGPPSHGDVIHRTECRYATRSNALRWFWGEEHPEWVQVPWLKHCGVCHPEEREIVARWLGKEKTR